MVIDTNIERMYNAGKNDIPNAAYKLSGISGHLYDHLQTFNKQAALAGDPAIMTSMLQVGGDLYDVLRDGVTSLNNCADALIRTADDFVRTDEDARDDYRNMDKDLKDAPLPEDKVVPPELKDPEEPGATTTGPRGSGEETPSTPDPEKPGDDAETRKEQEEGSEEAHEREKRHG
jgi:hypothetical protein